MRVLVTKLQKVERVAFAPEGTRLFASGLHGDGDENAGIEVFDLAGGAEPATHILDTRDVQWFVPLSGGLIASAHGSGHDSDGSDVFISDWRAGHNVCSAVDGWRVERPCAISSDGRLIACLSGRTPGYNSRGYHALEQGIGGWTVPGRGRPNLEWQLSLGRDREVRALAIAPDGRSFWTAEWATSPTPPHWWIELVSRDPATGNPLREPIAYPNQKISGLALSETFAVAHDGPTLFVYDLARLDRKPKKIANPAKRKYFAGFAIHPSGKWLAAAGLDGAVTLWNTDTWKVAQSWAWDAGQARSICFSADGTLAAAGTNTGQIVVWDLDL